MDATNSSLVWPTTACKINARYFISYHQDFETCLPNARPYDYDHLSNQIKWCYPFADHIAYIPADLEDGTHTLDSQDYVDGKIYCNGIWQKLNIAWDVNVKCKCNNDVFDSWFAQKYGMWQPRELHASLLAVGLSLALALSLAYGISPGWFTIFIIQSTYTLSNIYIYILCLNYLLSLVYSWFLVRLCETHRQCVC